MKNITEADINARINEQRRIYNHSEPLVFDHLGRYLIFDGFSFAAQNQGGFWNTISTLGSYYMSYNAYFAAPYVASTMYMWGGMASLLTIFNLARYLDRGGNLARIYLLQNCHVLRLENSKGEYFDVPISGITQKKAQSATGIVALYVNNRGYQVKLRQAAYFDPVLLYACVNPMVSEISGAISTSSQ